MKSDTNIHSTRTILEAEWMILNLTHWGRDKMALHFPGDIFKYIFSNENVLISINFDLNFDCKDNIIHRVSTNYFT